MKETKFSCGPLPYRIRNNLTQLYAKDITPDDKQELDEALQREVNIKRALFNIIFSPFFASVLSCVHNKSHILNRKLRKMWTFIQNHHISLHKLDHFCPESS